jgi:UDP:flavonoid glycosyltransferase YjiC (YdhE family)
LDWSALVSFSLSFFDVANNRRLVLALLQEPMEEMEPAEKDREEKNETEAKREL